MEPDSGKHSTYTHFPKDSICDIRLKTKITRASCRRRAGTVVSRAVSATVCLSQRMKSHSQAHHKDTKHKVD